MEDLIAAYPDDFFPRHSMRLCGRQQSFKGVGRFDLHFMDQFQSNILMELKAVPARYEDASQLAKYRDAMTERGDERIIMWLVAPLIPPSVREFLAHIGIEYSEIHEPEFRRIAQLRGADFEDSPAVLPAEHTLTGSTKRPRAVSIPEAISVGARDDKAWHFNTDEAEVPGTTKLLIQKSCFALWGYADTAKKMNRPEQGDTIFFYESRVGIVASGVIGSHSAISSDDIFGKQAEGEFRRSVVDLVSVPSSKAVTPAELRELGVTGPFLHSLCRRYPKKVSETIRALLEARSHQVTV